MSPTDDRPRLLILRTGRRELREYLLASIATRYRVHMLLGAEPTWEGRYISGASVCKNTLDHDELRDIATKLSTVEPFAGVMTWDESRTPQTAALAEALGLPGPGRAAVGRCRDKHQTRTALAAAKVGQPRSVKAMSVDEALAAAEEFGYPVVVKPHELALSVGVARVDNPDQLREQFAITGGRRVKELPDYRVQVLIEEYVDGDEISIDCAVHNGEVSVLCLARKSTAYPPYFIEVGHVVDAADPLLSDPELIALLRDTHAALDFDNGVTHTEVRLSRSGPKIIEVNARLGGDMIPYLGLRATGIDVGLAAADVATGRPPQAVPDRKLVAGVRFFNLDEGGTITSIAFDDTAGAVEAADERAVLAEPGQFKPAPIADPVESRIAFATAVGASQDQVTQALDAAAAGLQVTTAELS